jgi:hypothetical protein
VLAVLTGKLGTVTAGVNKHTSDMHATTEGVDVVKQGVDAVEGAVGKPAAPAPKNRPARRRMSKLPLGDTVACL